MIINHLPSRVINVDQEEFLFFSGTSYLGIGHQPLFRLALLDGIEQYGTVFSASRNNNLQIDIYEKTENFLAEWTRAEAALTVTSGLLAGQLAVQSLGDTRFIYAPSSHPALWHPSRELEKPNPPQYFFENYEDFSKKIGSIVRLENRHMTICSNTIDPLHGEKYSFDWLLQLPDNKAVTLIFDDSHGIGITHENGAGFYAFLKKNCTSIFDKKNIKIIVIASMAKALGIPGGVILSDTRTIQNIRKMPLFVGASPIVPAYLYAFLNTQDMYTQARNTLKHNIKYFKNQLEKLPFEGNKVKILPEYPVFFTKDTSLYLKLLERKILISSFAYPNPDSPPITRIIISALHTEGDIDFLVKNLPNS
jgi:7-keto-8-aminopelargonate synthetase-like enzyme